MRLKVDIIVVAGGIHWIRAAKDATKTIPIVMAGVGNDPVEAGLIESLARPGGNVTGLTNLKGKLAGKRLELLKEAIPKLVRVAVLYEPAIPANILEVKEDLPVAARVLGLTVRPWEVRAAEDFDRVFDALNKQRPDGLYVAGSQLTNANQKRIVSLTLKSRLPSMYGARRCEAGGLMSYRADLADSYRRVAYYVDRILKGAKPADLPVEQPTKFELVINLKTAKQIGLTIPPKCVVAGGQSDQVTSGRGRGRVTSRSRHEEKDHEMKKNTTSLFAYLSCLFPTCTRADSKSRADWVSWAELGPQPGKSHRIFPAGIARLGLR